MRSKMVVAAVLGALRLGRGSRVLRATAFVSLLVALLAPSATAAPAHWQARAERICGRFADKAERIQSQGFSSLPAGEQEARVAVADLFTRLAGVSLAADAKLTVLPVPARRHVAFTRALELDRLANGTLPLAAMQLLRGPAGDKTAEARFDRLAARGERLNVVLTRRFRKLGLNACAGGAADPGSS